MSCNYDPPEASTPDSDSQTNSTASGETSLQIERKTNVKVYLRMRPTTDVTELLEFRGGHGNILVARLPRKGNETSPGIVDNSKQEHTFYFDGIFSMETPQETVFQTVAVPVLEGLMNGINGTIFAYGQTGTGKTFTITGGAESYNDRGIIPRALSYIFSRMKRNGLVQYSVAISYLEVYQDKGYDLLTKAQVDARRLDDLQKVAASEDEDGNIILRGLSVNAAPTEEEALHLLFLGDTNRIVAETPLNDSSTRSHCIFIIWIEAREPGSSVIRRSKLHLVDLAGSERVKQSGVHPCDTVFREACSINLALHYLEQVIVALHERAQGRRVHVPYRNSMMTSVLRDSLGGNCQTVMVATVTPEQDSIPETVSTCRFAQAVARIENQASVNEDIDPKLLIKQLTRENGELRAHLQILKSQGGSTLNFDRHLSEEDQRRCEDYVDEDPEAQPLLGPDVCKIRFAFKIFRDRCVKLKKQLQEVSSTTQSGSCGAGTNERISQRHEEGAGDIYYLAPGSQDANGNCQLRNAVAKLRLHIQQRDAEIAILIDMLNRNGVRPGKERVNDAVAHPQLAEGLPPDCGSWEVFKVTGNPMKENLSSCDGAKSNNTSSRGGDSHQDILSLTDDKATALLLDRGRSFEDFRRNVRRTSIIADNRVHLQELYGKAKCLAKQANEARGRVIEERNKLCQLRVSQMNGSEHWVTEQVR
ncbi:putative kinesin-related protein 3A [Toxoplasma gondii ARI]|uniref:Kinesin-like protein n=1 Tax=Toxoplasma gondii ARI TaxID=1074872 RepID=A0A139XU29_TOXGO|nr:putative kinesin-related protein 3A [Toxoplasma gondii ARI]